ncbi:MULTISPECIES: hypothetical protein [Streptomyces]|uniref:Uncharacterized protein n=2 Tax=Streptomyces TaxID=1883 RepID=A0A939FW04_9ACTN|nr:MULTISPECIES: hypothetical protein [Streptomyces]MBO0656962.1 hypothetical protein [Streptomyces triculaminicus]QSY47630.1 hypothetical protein J3S04_20340 [Streptomyces griseocarneus]
MAVIDPVTAHSGFTELLAVSKGDQGPGVVLRTVLIVGVVGIVLVAWFLLRGYRDKD